MNLFLLLDDVGYIRMKLKKYEKLIKKILKSFKVSLFIFIIFLNMFLGL